MKKILSISFTVMLVFLSSLKAQTNEDKLDLPGDNLNLYAVLKLFQESETLEGFEKKLNDEENKINNLDLDGDEKIDYIKVIDNVDGEVHTIVLQVDVDANEKQDVAVFTVQKDANDKVQIQLIGDDELYGKDYIVEPNMEDVTTGETPNPGYVTKTAAENNQEIVVTNTNTTVIRTWPVVQYIFLPSYVVWRSPWYWHYYPSYWHPWRPFYWHYYWGYHSNWNHWYYGHFRRSHFYRYNHWNDFYYSSRRSRSPVFYNRRQSGFYRNTYSKPATRRDGDALYKKLKDNNRLPGARPAERPITKPVTRPVTKPTRPVVTPVRPVTRPVNPSPQRPVVKPARPVQKPGTRPVTQPAKPIAKPAVKPSLRTKN